MGVARASPAPPPPLATLLYLWYLKQLLAWQAPENFSRKKKQNISCQTVVKRVQESKNLRAIKTC